MFCDCRKEIDEERTMRSFCKKRNRGGHVVTTVRSRYLSSALKSQLDERFELEWFPLVLSDSDVSSGNMIKLGSLQRRKEWYPVRC